MSSRSPAAPSRPLCGFMDRDMPGERPPEHTGFPRAGLDDADRAGRAAKRPAGRYAKGDRVLLRQQNWIVALRSRRLRNLCSSTRSCSRANGSAPTSREHPGVARVLARGGHFLAGDVAPHPAAAAALPALRSDAGPAAYSLCAQGLEPGGRRSTAAIWSIVSTRRSRWRRWSAPMPTACSSIRCVGKCQARRFRAATHPRRLSGHARLRHISRQERWCWRASSPIRALPVRAKRYSPRSAARTWAAAISSSGGTTPASGGFYGRMPGGSCSKNSATSESSRSSSTPSGTIPQSERYCRLVRMQDRQAHQRH